MTSEFRLETGKRYVDRRGRVFGPMMKDGKKVCYGESTGDCGWFPNGTRMGPREPRETDLIAECVEPVSTETPEDCFAHQNWQHTKQDMSGLWPFIVEELKGKETQNTTPVESPDDWVVQDRVPYRKEFDECRWDSDSPWMKYQSTPESYRHGYESTGMMRKVLQVRCSRKDLPPLPSPLPPAKKIPVRLWVSSRMSFEEGADYPVRCGDQPPSGPGRWVEIHHSLDGFYVLAYQ